MVSVFAVKEDNPAQNVYPDELQEDDDDLDIDGILEESMTEGNELFTKADRELDSFFKYLNSMLRTYLSNQEIEFTSFELMVTLMDEDFFTLKNRPREIAQTAIKMCEIALVNALKFVNENLKIYQKNQEKNDLIEKELISMKEYVRKLGQKFMETIDAVEAAEEDKEKVSQAIKELHSEAMDQALSDSFGKHYKNVLNLLK